MATLRLAIDAREAMEGSRQFHKASEQIKAEASGIDANISILQKRISQGFKFAAFDERSLNQIKSQFETQTELQDRLFRATHTGLESSLRDHDEYYNSIKIGWQKNESMLTLITKAEAAERKKIIQQYAGDSIDKWKKLLMTGLRVGGLTYILNSMMDTATAMDKARRSGESMFDAFIAGLPIINRLADSARKMADQLSGAAEAAEMLSATEKLATGIKDMQQKIERSIELQNAATDSDKARLEIMFNYQDRLKEIGAIEEKEIERIRIYNKEIDKQIEAIKKMEGKPSITSYGGFGTMGVAPPEPDYEKQIADLERRRLNIEQFGAGVTTLAEREKELAIQKQIAVEIEEEYEHQFKMMKEAEAKSKEFAYRRADITARMYEDMGQFGTGYYESQKALLEIQRLDYKEFVNDKLLLEEWYSSKLNKIAVESSGFWLEVRDATQQAQSALSDYFMEFDNFENLIDSTGKAFQRMFANLASQLAMSGIMGFLVGGKMAGAMGFANPLAGMGNVQMGGLFGRLFGSARGNVFSNGRIVPMASGMVLNGPTYFPMADGNIGLAGEEGPELGFFPLKRHRGKLGIEASSDQKQIIQNEISFKAVIVDDRRKAIVEEMLSDEGQHTIIMALR